ncbi:MAG: hypothetical protein ACLFVR_16045, partial [Thiohalospira sp.]
VAGCWLLVYLAERSKLKAESTFSSELKVGISELEARSTFIIFYIFVLKEKTYIYLFYVISWIKSEHHQNI